MSNLSYFIRRLGCLVFGTVVLAGTAQAQTPYLGETRCGLWSYAPRGWAIMAGQLLPINQNQALFALLGTSYGGNGTTNFALPDMRGRVQLTMGQGPGLSNHATGERGGSEATTLSMEQMPAHNHVVAFPGSANVGSSQSPVGLAPATQARTTLYVAPSGTSVGMGAATVSSAGSGQPFNNMQPYLTATCVIAMQGIFPSRD